MVSVRVSLNLKGSKKIFPQETMAAGKNRFAPELNENEPIVLLEDLLNILRAFLIKPLFHSRLLDVRDCRLRSCHFHSAFCYVIIR